MTLPIKRTLAIGLAIAAIGSLSFAPEGGHAAGHVHGSGYGFYDGKAPMTGCSNSNAAHDGHEGVTEEATEHAAADRLD